MNRLWFERFLVVLLFLIQGFVVFVGVVNYNRMNDVIAKAGAPVQSSIGIELERSILVDINNAERNAKSFYLTRNGTYLSDYFSLIYKVSPKIETLDTLKWDTDEKGRTADSLIAYFEDQLDVLNELIYIENNEHVTDELNAITSTAERLRIDSFLVPVTDSKIESSEPEQKKSFLDRLFKRNKEREQNAVDSSAQFKKVASLNSAENQIKKEVGKVRSVQTNKLRKIKEQEFALTDKSVVISAELQRLIDKTDALEQASVQVRNSEAVQIASNARRINVIYSLTILLLLLTGSVIIIGYFIISGRQRKYLRNERETALKYAAAKQNLIANISHEMRTPLNSIIGFSNLLIEQELTKEQQENVNVIRTSSQHLLKVINDILDSSRLEAGKLELNVTDFNPKDLVTGLVASMRLQAEAKGLKLIESYSLGIPVAVRGDTLRFSQVVLNILSNAVKYTKEGFVKLQADYREGELIIVVSDSGIGIPADKIDTIFNRFEQASEKLGGSGAGLGLNIAKQLVELQNGSIKLESTLGEGTSVALSIPVTVGISVTSDADDRSLKEAKVDLSKVKILVADDEPFNRLLLMKMLRKYGNVPAVVEDGAQVLELLNHSKFDLILMDVRMPVLNGLEATKRIRSSSDQNISGLPIIALTAGLEAEKREKCKEAGMNSMLTKPYTEKDLILTVRTLLNL